MSRLTFRTKTCGRCGPLLQGYLLKCGNCRRTFHKNCRTSDEPEPAEEPTSAWKSKVCSTQAAAKSADELLAILDKQPRETELMNYVTFMVLKIKQLEEHLSNMSKERTVTPTNCNCIKSESVEPTRLCSFFQTAVL